jgi:hypothetical protein
MGFNIARTAQRTIPVVFIYDDETIEVKVKPNAMTPAFAKEIEAVQKESQHDMVVKLVSSVVVSWNLEWDGEDFPPTESNLSKCPYDFLGQILEKITEIWAGNAAKPIPSQVG